MIKDKFAYFLLKFLLVSIVLYSLFQCIYPAYNKIIFPSYLAEENFIPKYTCLEQSFQLCPTYVLYYNEHGLKNLYPHNFFSQQQSQIPVIYSSDLIFNSLNLKNFHNHNLGLTSSSHSKFDFYLYKLVRARNIQFLYFLMVLCLMIGIFCLTSFRLNFFD